MSTLSRRISNLVVAPHRYRCYRMPWLSLLRLQSNNTTLSWRVLSSSSMSSAQRTTKPKLYMQSITKAIFGVVVPSENGCRLLTIIKIHRYQYSSTSSSSLASTHAASASAVGSIKGWDRLRVAVVGGGAAGLSSALHLAPLVEAGWIASPIDIYESGQRNQSRDIGVGIWSTALDPFALSTMDAVSGHIRESHALVYQDMTTHGTWIGKVGYRTPDGAWLMKSRLPTSLEEKDASGMPALLFLREKDMLHALQKAVHWEEHRGTLRVWRDTSSSTSTTNRYRVHGLVEDSTLPWSAPLLLDQDQPSERDYHLIIAADGTKSILRRTYGGRDVVTRILTGTSALPSPIELPISSPSSSSPSSSSVDSSISSTNWNGPAVTSNTTGATVPHYTMPSAVWDEDQHQEAVGLQDRKYTVFRGNAQLTQEEMGVDGGASFQTWGEGHSMRFATVPMFYPGGGVAGGKRDERQVWFITINDDAICAESDPVHRRNLLLDKFRDWHDPVCRVVQATPPEEILAERAVAHRYSMGPLLNFNKVIRQMRGKRPPNSGEGPCMVFAGDACMTVDPILAQGFTVALESAWALKESVQQSCLAAASTSFSDIQQQHYDSSLAFDPYVLRKQLKMRHEQRIDRLICLLRATELVQALGQPSGGTISGFLNTKLL